MAKRIIELDARPATFEWDAEIPFDHATPGTYREGISTITRLEEYYAFSTTTTNATIDVLYGTVQNLTLDHSPVVLSFTADSYATPSSTQSFTLFLIQGSGGSKTVTWPTNVRWAGGTLPTLSTTAAAIDVFTFLSYDAGLTWFGFTAGLDMKVSA